jgi:hypothetical protein
MRDIHDHVRVLDLNTGDKGATRLETEPNNLYLKVVLPCVLLRAVFYGSSGFVQWLL